MPDAPAIVWFRRDLRLGDNPALRAAWGRGGPVIPVYIRDDDESDPWRPGAASRWWLHHSLAALDEALQARGSSLIVRRGPTREVLQRLARETQAAAVCFNRLYEPSQQQRDQAVADALTQAGLQCESFSGHLLREPWDVQTQQGGPYQVFTPFWKACCDMDPPGDPLPTPRELHAPRKWPDSEPLDSLKLLPRIPWDEGFYARWTPGERGASAALREFLKGTIEDYDRGRDRPGERGTSSLSPHLHFGEISPRQVWHEVVGNYGPPHPKRKRAAGGPMTFLSELGWREFAHHVLHHFPEIPESPLREKFANFSWNDDADGLEAWRRGRTGYPIVDAGMRELWATGWMYNRVRMIVGSFLTKDLLIPWQTGAAWFWDTLVDADLANNSFNWQWIAGCGADAAPYFRVFNPVTQGEKFDPRGEYVRRWVPEIAELPDDLLHHPWDAGAAELRAANLTLGETYPHPIVDHSEARKAALAAYDRVR